MNQDNNKSAPIIMSSEDKKIREELLKKDKDLSHELRKEM